MKPLAKIAATLIVLGTSPTLLSQWPRHMPANVPKGVDGSVNLDAPVPRAADGKPDLSGVWNVVLCIDCAQGRRDGSQAAGGRATMGNVGGDLAGGAPYQPWAADLVKKRMADNSKDNPDAHCMPLGIAQMNAHPYPRKIIQTPTEIILIGSGTTVREV